MKEQSKSVFSTPDPLKINHRPRKNLGWKTPNKVFYGLEILA